MPRTPPPRCAFEVLNPSGEAKRALQQEQAQKQLAEKKAKAVLAAERKREREAEKARVAAVDAELEARKRARTPAIARATAPAEAPAADEARFGVDVEHYANTPPYLGESDFEDRERLAQVYQARWYPEQKRWGTDNLGTLHALLKADDVSWTPDGLGWAQKAQLLALIEDRERRSAAADAARREAAAEEERRRAELAAVAARAERAKRERAERERAKDVEEKRMALRDRTSALPPTDEELQVMAAAGVSEATILDSARYDGLGPNFGISLEGRIWRYFLNRRGTVAWAARQLAACAEQGVPFVWRHYDSWDD